MLRNSKVELMWVIGGVSMRTCDASYKGKGLVLIWHILLSLHFLGLITGQFSTDLERYPFPIGELEVYRWRRALHEFFLHLRDLEVPEDKRVNAGFHRESRVILDPLLSR